MNQPISNPNDFKVVDFVNNTDFDFTPAMGSMYDSRPIFGMTGIAGIAAGERISLPYHIGHQLALNLAKQCLIRKALPHDPKDANPTGTPLWNEEGIEIMKNSFLTELYTNEKPVAMSETDKLMAQVAELNKLVRDNLPNMKKDSDENVTVETAGSSIYKDKAEVIAALKAKGITYNARDSKATLEKLLA